MQPFLTRLYIYQKERFPIAVHIPLIAAFSFSVIAYSRLCRGAEGFIHWKDYLAAVYTNFCLFFLLRVSDEHKDKEDDAKFRSYLPVPRGLISLKELRITALILCLPALAINIIYYSPLLSLYALMTGYLLLMRYEFFIPGWLRKHQIWYNISHMVIIPLADIYASGYDWKLAGVAAPVGLVFFFCVSYLNGMVLEIGRKLRTPELEEPGVDSYTRSWGLKTAPAIWITIITINYLFAIAAAFNAHHNTSTYAVMTVAYLLSITPAILFISSPSKKKYKAIEIMSLVWALCMYLSLGGVPLLKSLFFH